jgi:hypothetical protein
MFDEMLMFELPDAWHLLHLSMARLPLFACKMDGAAPFLFACEWMARLRCSTSRDSSHSHKHEKQQAIA